MQQTTEQQNDKSQSIKLTAATVRGAEVQNVIRFINKRLSTLEIS